MPSSFQAARRHRAGTGTNRTMRAAANCTRRARPAATKICAAQKKSTCSLYTHVMYTAAERCALQQCRRIAARQGGGGCTNLPLQHGGWLAASARRAGARQS